MITGDYDIRSRSVEQMFALNPLPDDCIDAANRAAQRFDDAFPGWWLYCRIVRGESLFDRRIMAWIISSAKMYARMRKRNGQCVVRKAARGAWIAQAAASALDAFIFGKFTESSEAASKRLGVDDELFSRFRTELLSMISFGFAAYSNELHYQLYRVRMDSKNPWLDAA